MGRKSSRQDRGEGATDKAKGRFKEAVCALTDDENKRTEGRLDQKKGIAKEKKGKLKDLLKQLRQRSQKAPGKGPKPSRSSGSKGARGACHVRDTARLGGRPKDASSQIPTSR